MTAAKVAQRTPGPLIIDAEVSDQGPMIYNRDDDTCVCQCFDMIAAKLIVQACNAHDDLVAALQAYVKSYGHIKPSSLLSQAEAALAKAEGQS